MQAGSPKAPLLREFGSRVLEPEVGGLQVGMESPQEEAKGRARSSI